MTTSFATGAAGWLLTYALHSTVLLGLAWIVTSLRRTEPATSDLVWKLALVGGLVTASAQTLLEVQPAGSVALIATTPSGSATTPNPDHSPTLPRVNDPEEPAASAAVEPAPAGSPSAAGAAEFPFTAVGIGLWLLLGLGLTAWYVGRRLILVGRLGDRRVVHDVTLRERLEALQREMGLRRRVSLTASTAISSPVALGRNEICLPSAAMADLDPEQQRAMLAHELAHLARRDPEWLTVACVLERVFFFQPLNRVARARIQESAEYLADEAAARLSGGVPLARCLVKVAEWIQASPLGVPVAGMAEQRSQLSARVVRLLESKGLGTPRRQRALVMASLGVLLLTVRFVPGANAPGLATDQGADPGWSSSPDLIQDRDTETRSETRLVVSASQRTQEQADPAPVSAPASQPSPGIQQAPGQDSTIVRAIIARLKDENAEVRRAAADALGQLEDPIAIPALVAALEDSDEDVREAALDALSNFDRGVPAAPIRRLLASDNAEIRANAVQLLGELRDRESVNAIGRLVSDQDAEVRHEALHALEHIGDPSAAAVVTPALSDSDADVRMTAIETMQELGGTIPDATLTRLLQDRSADVRQEAADYVSERHVASMVPQLVRMLDDPARDVRQSAAEALTEVRTPESHAALRRALEHSDPQVRRIAVEYFGDEENN